MEHLKKISKDKEIYISNLMTADIDFLPSDIRCKKYFIPTENGKKNIFNNYYDDIAARIIIESQKTKKQKNLLDRNNWVGLGHNYLLNQIVDNMKNQPKLNFLDKTYAKFMNYFENEYFHRKEPFSPIAIDNNNGICKRIESIINAMQKEKLIESIRHNNEAIYFPTNRLVTTAFYKQQYN
jgi:hypothetical protein